jgi:Ca2+-binding EF-hand superfamily protein
MDISDSDLKSGIEHIDKNKNGQIEFSEFIRLIKLLTK